MTEWPSCIYGWTDHGADATGFRHLEIEHDGTATWADIQFVKNEVWGKEATAFDLYPPDTRVVNGGSKAFHFRHLWKWPEGQPWPDIRGG